jgi:hypothetical protein
MEHVFSMLVARGFILQEKKFVAKKKLFVAHTFLLALCRRPYPLPLGLLVILAGSHVAA